MTQLRDNVEANASPLLALHARLDLLMDAAADLFGKLDAVTAILEGVGDDAEHAAALRYGEVRGKVLAEVERRRGRSPEALEEFIRRQREATHSQPFISTDRSPRVARRTIDGITVTQYDDRGNPVVKDRLGNAL
jgi:hypothetical protein